MTYFLWTLLSLSAVLTLCGGMALLFRLTRAGRCGRVMNAVWGIVLLLALHSAPAARGLAAQVPLWRNWQQCADSAVGRHNRRTG